MDLADALELGDAELVSFVGAGGKKTAMGRLVDEAARRNLEAVFTTTTHTPPPPDLPLVLASPDGVRDALEDAPSPVALARERVPNPERVDEKVRGFEPGVLDSLFESRRADWLLVKADGARMREFKAPGDDEPRIPSASTCVVPVASVRAVGESLSSDHVHRVERVARCGGIEPGNRITPEVVGRVLAHDAGGLKGVPADASAVPLVNKADTPALEERAREAVSAALERSSRFDRGLVCSLEADRITVVTRE